MAFDVGGQHLDGHVLQLGGDQQMVQLGVQDRWPADRASISSHRSPPW
ncbi:MAG TPA: hypothetical protein VGM60_03075 [Pseudonocardia sp.]|jgi:hypothetical protein